MPTAYEEKDPDSTVLVHKDYTWTQDGNGQAYMGKVVSTLSPGTASAATTSTVQALDVYGNLTQQQIYDYSSPSTPARTYNFTYLTDSTYTSRYIRNRLTLASVNAPGSGFILASNSYDGAEAGALQDRTGLVLHDSTYGPAFTYRGNPTTVTKNGVTASYGYEITGIVYQMKDASGLTITTGPSSSTNFSLPGILTPNSNNNLATSFSYDSNFLLTSVSGPNGATQGAIYDQYHRLLSSQSTDGAITTYGYTFNPAAQTATISTTANNVTTTQWKRTTMDGFGRPVKVESLLSKTGSCGLR